MMSDMKVSKEEIEIFMAHPVWRDFMECANTRLIASTNALVNEYGIDKIREHQGRVKELSWMLMYPKLLIDEVKQDNVVKESIRLAEEAARKMEEEEQKGV